MNSLGSVRTKSEFDSNMQGVIDQLPDLFNLRPSVVAGPAGRSVHKPSRAPIVDWWLADSVLTVDNTHIPTIAQGHHYIAPELFGSKIFISSFDFADPRISASSSNAWLEGSLKISSLDIDLSQFSLQIEAPVETSEVITSAQLLSVEDSYPFEVSEPLALMVLTSQAGSTPAIADDSNLLPDTQMEITSKVVEAVADIAYRQRRAGNFSIDLVAFDQSGKVMWCENEFAKLLSNSLNLSILTAGETLKLLLEELHQWLGRVPIYGRWGKLLAEPRKLKLVVTPAVWAEVNDDFL